MKKIALVVVFFMAGCATEAVLPSKATSAPSQRLLKYQNEGTVDGSTLIVVRDKGYLGSGCSMGVFLNNDKAAVLEPGEKATFNLKPGEWHVAMKGEGKFCLSDEVPSGREVQLKPGETKAVRLFADPAGNIDVKPLPLM